VTAKDFPNRVRLGVVLVAEVLSVMAALANGGHVFDYSTDRGNASDYYGLMNALLPDVMAVVCILVLHYDFRSVPAWCGLVTAIAVLTGATLDVGSDWFAGKATVLWPIIAALITATLAASLFKHEASPEVTAGGDLTGDTAGDREGDGQGDRTGDREGDSSGDRRGDPGNRPPGDPQPTTADLILAALEGGSMTQKELALAGCGNTNTIKTQLGNLKRQGRIVADAKAGRGKWKLKLRAVAAGQ
jgi:hypothetical protein